MMTQKALIFSKQASKQDDFTLASEHLFLCNFYDAGAC